MRYDHLLALDAVPLYSHINEASSFDRIWGIGYEASNAEANKDHWGQNLLGKALMRVRDRIRAEGAAQSTSKAEVDE